MNIRCLLIMLLAVVMPANSSAGSQSLVPGSCLSRKQEEVCRRDTVAALERLAALMDAGRAKQEVALFNPQHSVAQLCHMGVALFKRTEKDVVVLWYYLRARHAQWTPRMKAMIEAAAKAQAEKFLNREQTAAFLKERQRDPRAKMPPPITVDVLQAFRFVSEHLPGSSGRTKCTWKTDWFGWTANKSAKALQAQVPHVVADIARMLSRDVAADARNVNIGIVHLRLFDEMRY